MEGVSLRLILKDSGVNWHYICLPILLILTWRLIYSSKKREQERKRAMILKEGTKVLQHTSTGFKPNFMPSMSAFLFIFLMKKEYIPWSLSCFNFLIPRNSLELENIHTKAFVDVSRVGRSFGKCSAWEENGLPGERVCVGRLGRQEVNTQINY